MADLQELFARIKNQSADSSHATAQSQSSSQQPSLWASSQSPAHQQPSVSSPLFSPPIQTPNPVHSSNIISPIHPSSTVGTPGPDTNKTNHLLNLLKFNGQSGQQQGQSSPMANLQNVTASRHSSMHAQSLHPVDASNPRPLSAADLMSTLQRKTSPNAAASSASIVVAGAEKPKNQISPDANQDFLLNLLTNPNKPRQSQVPSIEKRDPNFESAKQSLADATLDSRSQAPPPRESTPVRQLGSPVGQSTTFQAPQPTKATMFSYVNPFDQLHTSSPLNRTPKPEKQAEVARTAQPKKIEILKHNRDTSSSQNGEPAAAPPHKSRKTDNEGTSANETTESKSQQQSVSQALEDVGEQVDKQVEQALAEADTRAVSSKEPTSREDANDDDVESSWESAEDTNKKETTVEVYNFPMKPFVSLQLKLAKQGRPVRQEHFMVIAQLKKEFDQVDRCLVTASQTHILYAQVATKKDNGGFRIIRQDNGDHKQVFRSSGERLFSVQLCNAATEGHDIEGVLGTGVNGTVFWTSLAKSRGDLFVDDDVEAQGFTMPAVTTAEESTSGSPVKTRAKLSSRHPDYFAIARGKHIFIVAPETVKEKAYCHQTTRKVNSEAYFTDHTLKINTAKAGKDFGFSEDDSVIVSLDKNGRFKFWDIRDLTQRASNITGPPHEPIELSDPLWTLNAAASGSKPDEKPSVSSILFLDKDRPYNKCTALRYLLIGFKQNHILQLWDLGLGKAVQELRLPHEKDSDGICSISYHPKTGIIAVAHPTRNSIFFIHLSAPKYNIPTMEQAKYISMLATNDSKLPKPESTAIMSGLREFSFAKVGQLRSVDMLRTPVENASERNTADETLFELYAMHSRGVIGISIKREDLGWDAQSKMVNAKDAQKEGVVEISELVQPQKLPTPSEQSSNADIALKPKATPTKKVELPKQAVAPKVDIKKELISSPAPATNGTVKQNTGTPANPPFMTPDSYSLTAQRSKSSAVKDKNGGEATDLPKKPIPPPKSSEPTPAAAPTTSQEDLQILLGKQFDSLYQRIESDKRVQDAAAGAKQDALLRLVSSTLTENVDRSLSNIITSRIEKDVLPILTDVTSKIIDGKIAELLPQQLNASVSGALKPSLSNALAQALKEKELQRTISEVTANSVAAKVQQQVSAMLQQSLPGMATQAAQKVVADVEKRMSQQLQQAEAQRQQDNVKIEELSNIIRSLSTTVQNMAASQSAFQEQILRMQKESRSQTGSSKSHASPAATPTGPQAEVEDAEVAEMTQMLMAGKYEEATIKWISSDRQAEIFDKLFIRVNPEYLQHVSQLVALTVSAAITSSFDTYVTDRLEWLGCVLNRVNMRDDDIREVAPKIMDVLSQRLQGAYMVISEGPNKDPATLRTIHTLNGKVNEIRRLGN